MTNGSLLPSHGSELYEALKRRRRIIAAAPLDADLRLDELREKTRRRNRKEASTQTAARQEEQTLPASPSCSESRLRAVLTQTGASTNELKEAILAVEALLGEARRELQNRQFRERRAAFERLYAAISREDEAVLAEAILEARRTEVDAEDIEKAEESLTALQALTDEQRAAKAAKEQETANRTRAFLLVKRDDVQGLRSHLEDMEATGFEWKGWKDHARRTLLQCSGQLGAKGVQAYLELIMKPNSATPMKPMCADPAKGFLSHMELVTLESNSLASAVETCEQVDAAASRPWVEKVDGVGSRPRTVSFHFPNEEEELSTASSSQGAPTESATSAEEATAPEADLPRALGLLKRRGAFEDLEDCAQKVSPAENRVAPEMDAPIAEEARALSPEEETKMRLAAFRAVVKDDTSTLGDIIHDKVPLETWRNWVNKGGKDLLTLSEERGSCESYSMLARALGLLMMRKRSSFCESEFVWVMLAGDVQPRRATVLEDVPDESDQIYVEFWDDNSEPMWVDRDFVLKSS